MELHDIIAIATNKTLTLEAKKRQIRAFFNRLLMEASDKTIYLDKHKRFVLKFGPNDFYTPGHYDAYMEKYGNLLINDPDSWNYTLLTKIAATDAYELVSWLIRQGARPNLASRNGVTPVHEACRSGQVKMLETLMVHGAKINASLDCWADDSCRGMIFKGQTPMHLAIRFGHVDCIETLLKQKSYRDLRHPDFSFTSLEWAKIVREHVLANVDGRDIVTKGTIKGHRLSTSALFGSPVHRDQNQIPTIEAMDKIIEVLEQYAASHKENSSFFMGPGIFSTKNLRRAALTAAGGVAIAAAYQSLTCN